MAFDWRNFRYTYDESVGYKYPDFKTMGEIIEYFSERGLVTTMGCTSPACPPTTDEIAEQYCIAIAELNHRNGDTSGSIPSGGGKCGGGCGLKDKADSAKEQANQKSEDKSTPDQQESSDPAAEEAQQQEENTLQELDEPPAPTNEGNLVDPDASQVLDENPGTSDFEDMVNCFSSYDPEKIVKDAMATLDVQKSRREAHRESLEGKRKSMDKAHTDECLSYNKEYTTECQKHKDDIFVSAVTKEQIEELTPDKVYDEEAPVNSEETEATPEEVQQEAETNEQESPSNEEPVINLMKGNCGGKKGNAARNQQKQAKPPTTQDESKEQESAISKATDWLLDTTNEALEDFADKELGRDIKDMALSAVTADLTGADLEHVTTRVMDRIATTFTKENLDILTREGIDSILSVTLSKLGYSSTQGINIANRKELQNALVSRALSFCAEKGYTDTFYNLVDKLGPASGLVKQYLPTLTAVAAGTIGANKVLDSLYRYAGYQVENVARNAVLDLSSTLTMQKLNLHKTVGDTVAKVNGYLTHTTGPADSAFTTALCNMAKPLVRAAGQTAHEGIERGSSILSRKGQEVIDKAYQASFIPKFYK